MIQVFVNKFYPHWNTQIYKLFLIILYSLQVLYINNVNKSGIVPKTIFILKKKMFSTESAAFGREHFSVDYLAYFPDYWASNHNFVVSLSSP